MKCPACGWPLEWRNMWGFGRAYVECTHCGATYDYPPPDERDEEEDDSEEAEVQP